MKANVFRASSWLGAGLLLLSTPAFAEEVKIELPQKDRIVVTSSIAVSGTGSPNGSTVSIQANGSTLSTTVTNGRWAVSGIALVTGPNVVTARLGGKTAGVLVTRATGISARPSQQVMFSWVAGVDDRLKQIARETLRARLSNAQLDQFVAGVKARTQQIFLDRYNGSDIHLVNSPGAGVHTIQFVKLASNVYGDSPGDCGNETPEQSSIVFVGTLRQQLGNFTQFKPMKKTDSLATRIEDIAQFLGRTSAHEFGHSLGLTSDSGPCWWMMGCDDWHNCDSFDLAQPLADRFNQGWHVMDPGAKSPNNARIGEPSLNRRAAHRTPAIFENFGWSYIKTIHP